MNGLLGTKKGMTQVFDEAGNAVPVTVIEAGPCAVTQVKTQEKDGYDAIQVGYGRYLRELRIEKPDEYKIGQEVRVEIFKPGEKVSVSGISVGKGFAGTVKRYHHARGPMTHGSKSHRIPGSIGAGTTPGRVYKGRGMPGRMGNQMVTVRNLKVVQVQAGKNVILLKGAVPGKVGSLVMIRKKGSTGVPSAKVEEAKK